VRIWDVDPGYLSRSRLLGEHRELHGVEAVISGGKKGYAHHPETQRWRGCLPALAWRHRHLAAEMRLRGYIDRTPLETSGGEVPWPAGYLTAPADQFALLRAKYAEGEEGRIPLPASTQELWAQHKYSVMARDPERYRRIGREVSGLRADAGFGDLARELVDLLRTAPPEGRIANAVDHMWGYVADAASEEERAAAGGSLRERIGVVRRLAVRTGSRYLLHSTALGELAAYCESAA
jgi:hypothetical protein